jgi:hypothetical protein
VEAVAIQRLDRPVDGHVIPRPHVGVRREQG